MDESIEAGLKRTIQPGTPTTAAEPGQVASEVSPAASAVLPEPEKPRKPRRVVRFVDSDSTRTVPLSHPVECDGVVYRSIIVRRLSIADFRNYFETPAEDRGRFPSFIDAAGQPVPDEVLDALSFEDSQEVTRANEGFLPAAFRVGETSSPTPETGEVSQQP